MALVGGGRLFRLSKAQNFLVLACLMIPSHAWAYDWVGEAKVTAVEVTYMPQSIPFYVDQAIGGCAAGTALMWTPRGNTAEEKNQNAQAVFSALLTAKSSGQKITAYVVASGCKVEYLYIK
jgi:hypothetical protein